MENITIDCTAAAHPSCWTNTAFAPTSVPAALRASTAVMPAAAKDRPVIYIGTTTAAAGSLRTDLGAKQAAPPRGNLR